MRYIITEIKVYENGAITVESFKYTERLDAEAKFHTILAEAAKSERPVHTCMMVTEDGRMVRTECYRHNPEPEPNEEPAE